MLQDKLCAFKARASSGRICKEFKSAEDLRNRAFGGRMPLAENSSTKSSTFHLRFGKSDIV
jgi:hypothetical protein